MPSYLSVGLGLPDFAVEVAFASLPTASTQTWTSVTPYVRQLAIRRGRNDELARVEAGTLDLLLDNRDARFNPENSSGPYFGNLIPKRQVRVWFRSGITEQLAFTGFVGGWPQEWEDAGKDALVRLGAVDLMGLLARARLSSAPLVRTLSGSITSAETNLPVGTAPAFWPTTFPYTITVHNEDMTISGSADASHLTAVRGANGTTAVAHDPIPGQATIDFTTLAQQITGLSGAAIQTLITNSLWTGLTPPGGYFANVAAGFKSVDTGLVDSDTNPLEVIRKVAESETGLFFAGRDGLPVFHDGHYRITTTTPTATFGDAGGAEIPYQDVEVSHDENVLYNNVVVTLASGQKLTATDGTSQAAYWPATLPRESIGLAGNAQDLAYYLLGRFKDPTLRIPDLVLDGHTVSRTTLIGLDLDQRYTVKRRPASGTAISKDVFVEGVSHSLAPASWVTSLNLSNASVEAYWVLGTSQLGTDTRLAF